MFHGSMVAIITAMTSDGTIDEKSLRHLIDFHIDEGSDAIVVMGTTGEASTLDNAEKIRVIRLVVEQAKSRIPIIAGTGTNCTAKTIKATQAAMDAGVDGCLIVTPYYNKPTQEGLYQHFKTIAHAVATPIILYNVPSRTGVDMRAETVARLAKISNIIGLKEASGKVERCQEILDLCGDTINLYSGEDNLTLDLMKLGAKGTITVTGNVAPKLMHEMCTAALKADWKRAEMLNKMLIPLHKNLFLESNPIPVKWACYKMGLVSTGIRLPLTLLSKEYEPLVLDAMQQAKVIVE